MTKLHIKPFDFVDYFDKTWTEYKTKNFQQIIFNEMAAFAGNISKVPITWDEDDWRFLSQFPPRFWSKALLWRYNEGLREIARQRDKDPEKKIPDWNYKDKMEFKDHAKLAVFKRQEGTPGIYTGLKNLLEKLEKPVQDDTDETGSPGLRNIDPFQHDPAHEKYRGKYKGGKYDYDFSGVKDIPDEYFDYAIPDEEIEVAPNLRDLPTGHPERQKAIAAIREDMKKRAHHTFAGGSVLKPNTVSDSLTKWIKAQALGLLGKHSDNITDPNTGQQIPTGVTQNPEDVKSMYEHWTLKGERASAAYTGKDDSHVITMPDGTQKTVQGKKELLKIPYFNKNIKYEEVEPNGHTREISGNYKIPVLNPGKLLPIVNPTLDQRLILAKRRGHDVEEIKNVLTNPRANRDEIAKAKLQTQWGDIQEILKNWDILTDEQKNHLKENQRDVLHVAAQGRGLISDPHSRQGKGGGYYTIGWQPNKVKRGLARMDIPDDKKQAIIDKYLPQMRQEADVALGRFLKWACPSCWVSQDPEKRRATGSNKMPRYVWDVLDGMRAELALIGSYILVLNLNDPTMGVRDEELGLTAVQGEATLTELKEARKQEVFNLVKDISQAAIGSIPSRRQRTFLHTRSDVSASATNPSGEGSTSDLITARSEDPNDARRQGTISGALEDAPEWRTRRQQLRSDPQHLGRAIWQTPELGHAVDKEFQTLRNLISLKLGGKYGEDVEKARRKLKLELELSQGLYDEIEQQLAGQNLTWEEKENKAHQYVSEKLPEELKRLYPDIYGNFTTPEEWAEIARKVKRDYRQSGGHAQPPTNDPAADRAWDKSISELIRNGESHLPNPVNSEDPGPRLRISQFPEADATKVAKALKYLKNPEGDKDERIFVSKWAVPLLMAIAANNHEPMSKQDAIHAVQAAGIQPIESHDLPEVPSSHQTPTQVSAPTPIRTAAREIPELLEDLPGNYNELRERMPELLQRPNTVKAALRELKAKMLEKIRSGQRVSQQETNALTQFMRLFPLT
jgi:hypothetical protein